MYNHIFTTIMSIFSRKSKPKEPDDKSKKQQPNTNGSKADGRKHLTKQPPSHLAANGAQTAGDRTAQRAAIMAASRRRMNSETPDYSIVGASKSLSSRSLPSTTFSSITVTGDGQSARRVQSNDTPDPVPKDTKAAPKIFMVPQQNNDMKRRKTDSGNESLYHTPATSFTSAKPAPRPPVPWESQNGLDSMTSNNGAYTPVQRKLAPPLDSPTLGYSPAQAEGYTQPQTSSDSGYDSLHTDSGRPSEVNTAVQQTEPSRFPPRVESRFAARLSANRELLQGPENEQSSWKEEGKTLITPTGVDPRLKYERATNRFVSRLDPGPTRYSFAEPIDPPELSPERTESGDRSNLPSQRSPQNEVDLTEPTRAMERGRNFSQKFTQPAGPFQPTNVGPNDLTTESTKSAVRAVPDADFPTSPTRKPVQAQPSLTRSTRATNPRSTRTSVARSERDAAARNYSLPGSNPESTGFKREASTMGQSTSKPFDAQPLYETSSSTTSILRANAEAYEQLESGPVLQSAMSSPPRKTYTEKRTSTQRKRTSSTPQPQQKASEPRASYTSERRSSLPPLSAMDGFKVNRRGQVLDEEGDIIGELFEGDIIDCVRQKVNADGDVVDEWGNPVGRVRTVPKGQVSSGRFSVASIYGMSHPTGPYPWARRDSDVLQYYTESTRGVESSRASVSHVSPPQVDGNVPVAELDASAETEAAPVLDHSEIFIPDSRATPSNNRSESASTLRGNEPATEERPSSQSALPETKQGSPAREGSPQKWNSRYFDSATDVSQTVTRRSSLRPETLNSDTIVKLTNSKSVSKFVASDSSRESRAVLGPTLESLMKSPVFSHDDQTFAVGGSMPNLPLTNNGAASAPSSPVRSRAARSTIARPASIQFNNAGSHLSARSSFSHHHPSRPSPLGNYGKCLVV